MKQPLITIEGKDKPCENKEHDRDYHLNFGWDCGKSPTKLIFDAKKFKCNKQWYKFDKFQDKRSYPKHLKSCECKGTSYLLPKKGDELYFCECQEKGVILTDFDGHITHDFETFRLSSDAELKSVGALNPDLYKRLFRDIEAKHNLLESSMLVIAEGYYE